MTPYISENEKKYFWKNFEELENYPMFKTILKNRIICVE